MPIADGEVFAGYTVERLLGVGGMGEVYLARHPRLPRQEALKILPAEVSSDPEYRQRFAREADIAAALWHPHIVAVHDRGEHDGQLWIAMDYVEGTDAARLVREQHPSGMPPTEVFEIVSAIADALDYAHARDLLHRDVKPANILIAGHQPGDRRILLADFGIARGVNDTSGLTATNTAVGSIAYAAPEQLIGKAIDGRADQYALAGTAFHLLTGQPPFVNSNPAVVISNHLTSPPPRAADIRPDLGPMDHALARAMAKEPHQRFSSCREFAAALASSVADATQVAITYSAPPQWDAVPGPPGPPVGGMTGVAPTPRGTAVMVLGVVATLVAVGVLAFLGVRLAQPRSGQPGKAAQPAQTVPATNPVTQLPTATRTAPSATDRPSWTAPGSRPPQPAPVFGDLGLAIPMSVPACDGSGVVIMGSAVTPGAYAADIQRMLAAHPGAAYLRTDQACPSLRQATAEGNPIYAVFAPAGRTQGEVCAAVHAAGGDSYGKWLDTTTNPMYIIPC